MWGGRISKAYCYLLVAARRTAVVSDARRRLRAIEEFSDLGSGFNIAMQDLDIRGAGNLLGAEQSGFIADIGFETYQKIMREAVAELRAEGLARGGVERPRAGGRRAVALCGGYAHVEVEVEAELPDSYVSAARPNACSFTASSTRRAGRGGAATAFEQPARRTVSGRCRSAARELLDVVRLRWEAVRLGMERVKVKNGLMIVHFVGDADVALLQERGLHRSCCAA